MIELPSIEEQENLIEACELGIRVETLTSYSENWPTPTASEVRIILKLADLTGSQAANVIGVNSRTVRKWTGDERAIPYSSWAILVSKAGIKNIWA